MPVSLSQENMVYVFISPSKGLVLIKMSRCGYLYIIFMYIL